MSTTLQLESNMNLASVWEQIADAQPDALALANSDTTRTWAQYEDRAARLASALGAAGVGPGDNVACAMYNGNEYMEAAFAAFKVRAAPCNVNYRYVEAELLYLIDNSDAKAVFFDASLAERFGNVREQLPDVQLWIQVGGESVPDWAVDHEAVIAGNEPAARIPRSGDDLWILYTGGTTGNPKGVMWPHQNVLTITGRIYEALGLELPASLEQVGPAVAAIAELGCNTSPTCGVTAHARHGRYRRTHVSELRRRCGHLDQPQSRCRRALAHGAGAALHCCLDRW